MRCHIGGRSIQIPNSTIWNLGFVLIVSVLMCIPHAALAQQHAKSTLDLGIDKITSQLVLPEGDPRDIAVRLINVALQFLAIIVLVMVVWSGFLFLFSGGKKENMERAGAVMRNAIIGLIIILCSWAIVRYVISSFIGAINGTDANTSALLDRPRTIGTHSFEPLNRFDARYQV